MLVHTFIIRIYHDARSSECQISKTHRVTSKFKVSEGWHETSSILRIYKYWAPPYKI